MSAAAIAPIARPSASGARQPRAPALGAAIRLAATRSRRGTLGPELDVGPPPRDAGRERTDERERQRDRRDDQARDARRAAARARREVLIEPEAPEPDP